MFNQPVDNGFQVERGLADPVGQDCAVQIKASLPFRASVRQDERWFAFNPCLRATSFTVTPGISVSATIRPFASSEHRRLAAGAAKSSTNPTASILRSRWTPTDASRANLHTEAHRSLPIQQEGGVRAALTVESQVRQKLERCRPGNAYQRNVIEVEMNRATSGRSSVPTAPLHAETPASVCSRFP